ncbi:MAG: NAD(P)H-hydrate dehydratase [Candidatus Micrarchaeota archaeon]
MVRDIKKIFRSLHYPKESSHKGQNGKLLIIGGSKMYSGSPLFSILAARRFVDLLYFYPAQYDSFLIQAVKNIPETIVIDDLNKIKEVDCVLFGGGMGLAKFNTSILKDAKKVVVDAQGFEYLPYKMINSNYILTPHVIEFERYFKIPADEKNIISMAKKYKCTILKKGTPDIISNGKKIFKNDTHNPGMTKGGTGDTLAGLVAALACTNQNFEAAVAGTYINGLAGNMLTIRYGYNFCASDLANTLAKAYFKYLKTI